MDIKGFEVLQNEVLKSLADVSKPHENEDDRFVTIESTTSRDAAYIMNLLDIKGMLHDSKTRRNDAPSLAYEGKSLFTEPGQGVLHTVLLFRDTRVE